MSIEKGQFPKSCDLCETEIKINWKCINCNLFICSKCKEKVHSKIKSAEKHKIVDIKELAQHSEELDFSNVNCEYHDGQTCVMFCKSCDRLVCTRCIAEVHNGHGLVQISEGFKIQIENVKTIQKKIKHNLEELTNGESQIKLLRKCENSKYIKARNLIQTQNATLKREVDKYTEKLNKELDQKWKTLQDSLDTEEHEVTAMKIKQEDQNTKVDDIINSNDAEKVFKECKQMEKFLNDIVEPVRLCFNTMPNFSPGKITEDNFGLLNDIPKDLVLNIHEQVTTDIANVYFLVTCPDNSLWISDENVLQRVKPEGNNLKVMSNFNMKIFGMAVTPSNDLLLANGPRLQQISGSSGQITDSVYSVDPLVFTTFLLTSDYKVIAGACDSGRNVIIRMNKEGKHEKTYEHDRNKQPIFTYVYYITITTIGTIFVVDMLSEDDCRGRIVILGQNGDVINAYTGHPRINYDNEPFKPQCAVATPLDNIIVTDLDTHTFHILNSVGHLNTCYTSENIGILRPYSLSFTSTDHLYIGCSTEEGSEDNAKLYKVDISPI